MSWEVPAEDELENTYKISKMGYILARVYIVYLTVIRLSQIFVISATCMLKL